MTLEFAPQAVKLKVRDNGEGFKIPTKMGKLTFEGKLGLVGMQQRANLLGGTFDIQSASRKGTSVSIELKA